MAVVKEKIKKALENPLERVTVDGTTTTWRSTDDLIRADRYLRTQSLDPWNVLLTNSRKAEK